MATPKVLILRSAGINCDGETGYAFQLAGAQVESIHINRLLESPQQLQEFQILTFPGGFCYGDDIAAGRILANQIVHHLLDEVRAFVAADKLVLGICNGFQALVKTGLLPGGEDSTPGRQQATITFNDSAKFEDRWVYLEPATDKCVFLDRGRRIAAPVAHGEGKLCFADTTVLQSLADNGQVALRYVDAEGKSDDYPVNPNASEDHVAGLCDSTGRIFGLMPHPERFIQTTQHPRWTRQEITDPDGLTIFRNAVAYFN